MAEQFGYGAGQPIVGKYPRPVGGIPTEEGDTIEMLVRFRTAATAPLIQMTAVVYNPRTDLSWPVRTTFTPAGTAFAVENGGALALPPGCVLTAVGFTSSALTSPVACYVAAVLSKGGVISCVLCEGYLSDSHQPCWPQGTDQGSKVDPYKDGAIFIFIGKVTNGAGGAGTQSATFVPAAGSRFEIIEAEVINSDTVARLVTISVDDGTNTLWEPVAGGSANAGAVTRLPIVGSAFAAAGNAADQPRITVADGMRFVMSVAAVAASQDTDYRAILRVWGAAPTVTLAGASTPTLTVTTSTFALG